MTASQIIEAKTVSRSDKRFPQPENFDTVDEGKGWRMMAGCNDWEGCSTYAAVIFSNNDGDSDRIWIKIKFPKELKAIAAGDADRDKRSDAEAHAEKMWKAWLKAARALRKADEFVSWKRAFEEAARTGVDFAEEWGIDHTTWMATAVVESLLDDTDLISKNSVLGMADAERTAVRYGFSEPWRLHGSPIQNWHKVYTLANPVEGSDVTGVLHAVSFRVNIRSSPDPYMEEIDVWLITRHFKSRRRLIFADLTKRDGVAGKIIRAISAVAAQAHTHLKSLLVSLRAEGLKAGLTPVEMAGLDSLIFWSSDTWTRR